MARQLGEEVGETVGYSIRFESRVSKKTRIEIVTEGILTRRLQNDPALDGVPAVIFDEFHERSLHADLALALCLDARKNLRDDLKIIVMSATLDCGPIAALLGNAPVLTSQGRVFPVEERYIPGSAGSSLPDRIMEAAKTALAATDGDILVFLPGAGEIRACSAALQQLTSLRPEISVHPLYGDLPFEEQERAIMPSQKRKIVLATNIAETSLTIEGVTAVIDSGLTRRLQYDPATGMNRLVTITASKASSDQRKGRAGRLSPGTCCRLYSRHTFQSMLPFTPPEIAVSDLASLALELAAWGIKEPSELSWLDTPPAPSWSTAIDLLKSLGALGQDGAVSPAGRVMARLPLHPRLAKLLIRAGELGCHALGADLAALLSERDIIRRAASGRMLYDRNPDLSDRLEILRKWRKSKESGEMDIWAVRNVDRISKQLLSLVPDASDKSSSCADEHEIISRLLLCAFPERIAKKRDQEDGRFVTSQGRGVKFSSINSMSRSEFIVAAHLDAGDKGEGTVYLAAPLTEEIIRDECGRNIAVIKQINWDKKEKRVIATLKERLGAIIMSDKPFSPSDVDAAPILCKAIQENPGLLSFTGNARQLQGRVALMHKTFADESWPELSEEYLFSDPEKWLKPYLAGVRTAQDLSRIDTHQALRAMLSWKQARLLDELAPTHITVPSGSRIAVDYASGDIPVLAVKLQEMFGLADTPIIAKGRVKLLLHLLSPAKRPLQITQDLKAFWNSSYHQVKKEMKGRYPKHPWPEDPWNAVPTRKVKKPGSSH
jgi:ATP-dependent helicase HrpB